MSGALNYRIGSGSDLAVWVSLKKGRQRCNIISRKVV